MQTRHPTHHALVRAARHDSDGFLGEERRLRESPPYPPATALVNLVVSGLDERRWPARGGGGRLVPGAGGRARASDQVLGPAPCPLARIKDRWRWHVLLKGRRQVLGRVVRYAARRLPRGDGVRVAIDRDPVSLL